MHKSVHNSSVPDSYILLLLFIVKSYYSNVFLFSCQMCMYVCTKSTLKTTTNSLCVCAHLANKANSDSDNYFCVMYHLQVLVI